MACGKRFGRDDRFCARCGTARPVAAFDSALGEAARLERRHLTVLFCDLVGSTELAAAVDPEELAEIILAYRTLMQARVASAGGTVSQYVGDGISAYFGFPQAQDDDAARAVAAGLHMLRSMPLLNARFAGRLTTTLRIRIGVRSGLSLVELADTSGPGLASVGAIGQAPNIAARLQALAEPDTMLVSAETRALTASLFVFEPKGEVTLKGVPGKITVFRPTGERRHADPAAGTASGVHGHQAQIDHLRQLWGQASAGDASRVLLTGEPGIGKTFVTNQFVRIVREQGGLVLRFGGQFDAAYSPFRMVLDGLQRQLLLSRAPPLLRGRRLQRVLRRAGLDQAALLPLLCEFLSLAPPPDAAPLPSLTPIGRRLLLRRLLFEHLARATQRQAILLLVENAHWLDPSSEDWLAALVGEAGGRVMLLVTARPSIEQRWTQSERVEHVVLERLDNASLYAILDALDAERVVGERLRRLIIERSDGVPLFLEELFKHVAEGGALIEEGMAQSIPHSLRSMLAARLDRLGTAKPIALAAAVVGRYFWLEPLRTLLSRRARTIAPGLALLTGADIIAPQQARGIAGYSFKHALLRDAAYDSLLTASRRSYHAKLARAYPKFAPDIADEQPEVVAAHASLGGLDDQALALWTRAGSRALDRSLYRESAAHFRRALGHAEAIAPPLPPAEIARLCSSLATALIGAEGFAAPEVERLSLRAYELCDDAADLVGLTAAIGGLTTFYQVRGPLSRARVLAERLVAMAQAEGDDRMLIRATRRLGWCRFCLGEVADGKQMLRQVLNRHDTLRRDGRLHPNEIDAGVIGHVNLGWAECFAGDTEEGLALCRAGLDLAVRLGERPADMAYALSMSAATCQVLGDHAGASTVAERAQAVARENALPYWLAWSTVLLGWSRIPSDPALAAHTILRGERDYRRTGARLFVPYNLGLAAEAFQALGRHRTALLLLNRAEAATSATQARFSQARLLLIRADALDATGRRREAAACREAAADLSREQGMRLPDERAQPEPGRLAVSVQSRL